MAHNLGTLRARVKARVASTPGDSLLTDAQINDFINRALQNFSLEQDWPWQKTVETRVVTVGADSFAVPTGWYRTESITHQDTGWPLERRAPKYLDRVLGQGRPEFWAPFGAGTILLRYAPDQTYSLTHRYMKLEPTLSADGDAPLVPEAFSQAIVDWAAYQALTLGNSVSRAQAAMVDYIASLKRIRDNNNQGAEPLRITVRPGSWV